MQLNEAMFAGTPGWVQKPARLLGDIRTNANEKKMKLRVEIAGLSAREWY